MVFVIAVAIVVPLLPKSVDVTPSQQLFWYHDWRCLTHLFFFLNGIGSLLVGVLRRVVKTEHGAITLPT